MLDADLVRYNKFTHLQKHRHHEKLNAWLAVSDKDGKWEGARVPLGAV